jgi:hypothetical protein
MKKKKGKKVLKPRTRFYFFVKETAINFERRRRLILGGLTRKDLSTQIGLHRYQVNKNELESIEKEHPLRFTK